MIEFHKNFQVELAFSAKLRIVVNRNSWERIAFLVRPYLIPRQSGLCI
jgi:hypothetical protein